jgi:hypothetical protein
MDKYRLPVILAPGHCQDHILQSTSITLAVLVFDVYPKSTLEISRIEIERQDGRRRLEHEKVVASAPVEESGAGVARGEESCELNDEYQGEIILTHRLARRKEET